MARCRFVQPDVVRLQLADVRKRAHEALVSKGVELPGNTFRPATDAEIAASATRVASAVEDGDWIDVKKELNAGESRKVYARLVKTMHFNEKAEIDPEQVGLSKVVAFLVGWSFVDAAGKTTPVSDGAINALDGDTYAEVVQAIDAHEEAGDAAREHRKNATGDESKSNQTLPSVA